MGFYQQKLLEADGLVEVTIKSNHEIPADFQADLVTLNQHEGGLKIIESHPDFTYRDRHAQKIIRDLANWETDHGAGHVQSAISETIMKEAEKPYVIVEIRVKIARALCDANRNPPDRPIDAGAHTHAKITWPTATDYFKNPELVKTTLERFHSEILQIEAKYLNKLKPQGRIIDIHTMDSYCRREKCPPDQIEEYLRTGIEAQEEDKGHRRHINTFTLSNIKIDKKFQAELDKRRLPHRSAHPYDLPKGHRMEEIFHKYHGLIFDIPKDLLYKLPTKNIPPTEFNEENIQSIAHAAAIAILY